MLRASDHQGIVPFRVDHEDIDRTGTGAGTGAGTPWLLSLRLVGAEEDDGTLLWRRAEKRLCMSWSTGTAGPRFAYIPCQEVDIIQSI